MPDVKLPNSKAVLQLSEKDLVSLDGEDLKVGSKVRILIYGTVSGVAERAAQRMDDTPTQGSLEIDVREIFTRSNNDIQELFEEDF